MLFDACRRPSLVVTDSQAFTKVAADLPEDQALTSFSILLARKKGDLATYLDGIAAIDRLARGAKVLVLEACSHHRQAEDLGTVKIPRLFRQLVPRGASSSSTPGSSPDRKSCALRTGGHLRRLHAHAAGSYGPPRALEGDRRALENYGLFLAWANGLLPRAVEMLPEYRLLAPGGGGRRAGSGRGGSGGGERRVRDGPRPPSSIGPPRAWQAASSLGLTNAYLLPSPLRVGRPSCGQRRAGTWDATSRLRACA